MTEKARKIIYRLATGILTIVVLMYAENSIFNYEIFSRRFGALGYPTYIIYPLAIAKLLGLIAIWSDKSKMLKEWAYAGFFFDFVLAMMAEARATDGELLSASTALIGLIGSYILWKKGIKNPSILGKEPVVY